MISEFSLEDLSGIREAHQRDGAVVVRNVLDADFVQELNQHIDWLIERHPELRPESLGHRLIPSDPFWLRFLSDERLLDVAEAFVGPNIAFFAADYIAKPPREGLEVRWHQDAHYWPLEPMEVIVVWFAVSKTTPENGCVRVIPGSHRQGSLSHQASPDERNLLSSEAAPAVIDESLACDIELNPGDISIHHPLTLHGSNQNTSDQWRRGGTIIYMPPTTRITADWPCAYLFRGEPVPGVNDYKERPRYVAGEHMPFRGCEQWA